MSTADDPPRSIDGKVKRLRERLAKAKASGKLDPELSALLSGFLDLLADEL